MNDTVDKTICCMGTNAFKFELKMLLGCTGRTELVEDLYLCSIAVVMGEPGAVWEYMIRFY